MYRYILFFFFNDTATTEIYTLSLHDALPISRGAILPMPPTSWPPIRIRRWPSGNWRSFRKRDRKSTRLNSSHGYISYAVFCLKKKKENRKPVAKLIVQRFAAPTRRIEPNSSL